MERTAVLEFATAARRLGEAARSAGLVAPAFRSPPRRAGVPRTIRRHPGGATVSVVLRGRPFPDVARDMVDGVLVANRVRDAAAAELRAVLLAALGVAPPTLRAPARVAERQTQAA